MRMKKIMLMMMMILQQQQQQQQQEEEEEEEEEDDDDDDEDDDKNKEEKEDENEEDGVDDNNDDDFVVVVVAVVGRAGVTMMLQGCRIYNMYMSPDWTSGLAALAAARFPLMRKQYLFIFIEERKPQTLKVYFTQLCASQQMKKKKKKRRRLNETMSTSADECNAMLWFMFDFQIDVTISVQCVSVSSWDSYLYSRLVLCM